MARKPLVWLEGEIKTPPFSESARVEAGFLLSRLQQGESIGMPLARPMPTIEPGCHELRIRDREATWRIIFSIEHDAIVILEIFSKKTQKTPERVLKAARRRLSIYRSLDQE